MNNHKILYMMNVDWNWIKQRPHYIAEELSKIFKVKIVYKFRYNRSILQKRKIRSKNLIPIYLIPKLDNINYLVWINKIIFKFSILWLIKKYKINILYLTYPDQINLIPHSFKGRIIYDCMDNHIAFINNKRKKDKLEQEERKLLEKSDCTLISSKYLLEKIKEKYNVNNESLVLVRNAYNGEILLPSKINKNSKIFKMAYIGTLSSWFDWNTVIQVLKKRNNIEVHLFGPLEKTIIPTNLNIIYHGTIAHSELYNRIKDMDALIMPFVVNDIIKAVDPVKIYEYINFNKDIIMCKYEEVERLKNYVYFYSSATDFVSAIDKIKSSKEVKYSNNDRIEFLQKNKWSERVTKVIKIIEEWSE